MKRSWFGVGLLAAMLVLSLLAGRLTVRCCDPASKDLAAAGECVLAGDWDAAAQLTQGARNRWERYRSFGGVMGNQRDMEEVDSLLARLEVYLCTRDLRTPALCAEIAQRVADLSPSANWWDLL